MNDEKRKRLEAEGWVIGNTNDFMSVNIERAFAIFVRPEDEDDGTWLAHVVGHELDNMTQGHSPEGAVYMACDLLCALTGREFADVEREELAEAIADGIVAEDE